MILHKTKLGILQSLSQKPLSWSSLIDETKLSKAGLYQHLKELRDKGFITRGAQGKYTLTKEGERTLRIIKVLERTKELAERSETDLSRIEKFLSFYYIPS